MVGREVTSIYSREPFLPGPELLRVEGLYAQRSAARYIVRTSRRRDRRPGRSGRARDAPNCAGRFSASTASTPGRVYVAGKPVDLAIPAQAVEAGIALIPEDRGRDGLARRLPIAYNVTAASLGRLSSGVFCVTGPSTRFPANTSASCASSARRERNWRDG